MSDFRKFLVLRVRLEEVGVSSLSVLATSLGKHRLKRPESALVFLEGKYLDGAVKQVSGE